MTVRISFSLETKAGELTHELRGDVEFDGDDKFSGISFKSDENGRGFTITPHSEVMISGGPKGGYATGGVIDNASDPNSAMARAIKHARP